MWELTDYKPNREYWNIVKGIGIVFVILGHTCMWAQPFIYTFHLQLFFFVSGFLYSEKKYGAHPILNTKNKFITTWKTYVLVYIVIILLHNVFYDLGLQPLAYSRFEAKDFVIEIIKACFGSASQLMAGPMWFLPVSVLGMVIFGFIVSVSRYIEKWTNSTKLKLAFQFVVIVVCCVTFYGTIYNDVWFVARVNYAFEILPYIWVGYLLRNYIGEINRFLHPVLGLICSLIVYRCSLYDWCDFTIGRVHPYMHFFALFGIYMCLCFAKVIKAVPHLKEVVGKLGVYSLIIMIAHFQMLRIFDKCITLYIGDPTGEIFNHIPVVFEQLWPVYSVVIIFGSICLVYLWDFVKRSIYNARG